MNASSALSPLSLPKATGIPHPTCNSGSRPESPAVSRSYYLHLQSVNVESTLPRFHWIPRIQPSICAIPRSVGVRDGLRNFSKRPVKGVFRWRAGHGRMWSLQEVYGNGRWNWDESWGA